MFKKICAHHETMFNCGRVLARKIQANRIIPQMRGYAAPAPKGRQKGPMLTEDQREDFVEADAAKLCKNVCINYRTDVESPGPEIKADSEYPDWLFKLDLEPDTALEDLDPEKDGWKYWEKWKQRRHQILLHNKINKYKYFWDIVLRHNKYKKTDKGHIFHIIPKTCGGVYMKAQKHKRLNDKSSEEVPKGLFKKLNYYLKRYWYIALPVHTLVCAIWLAGLYLAVQSGLDVVALLERLHMPESWIKKVKELPKATGSLAAALVLYKIATPLRYACSIFGIRLAFDWLKRVGLLRTARQLQLKGMEKTEAMRRRLQERRKLAKMEHEKRRK